MAAESDVVVFSIHCVGDSTGKVWAGEFETKKRLSKIDQCRQDNFFRFYLGENNPSYASLAVQGVAEILSQLRTRLVKCPSWWTESNFGERIEDDNLLGEIYKKVTAVEAEELEKMKKRTADARNELHSLGTLGEEKPKL